MAFRSALIAQQGLRVLSGMQIPFARRLLSSTPLDDFNKELTVFFGTAPGEQTPAATNAVPKAGTEPAERATQTDVAMFNSELFGLLGSSQRDAAVAATSLAQQLVKLTAQQGDAPPLQSNSSASTRPSSSGSASTAAASDFSAGDSCSSSVPPQQGLTHVDEGGRAAMVDVSDKAATVRTATAGARVLLGPEVFDLVSKNQLKKGDVLTVAQLAGVMGAKHTSALIPLCHNILLSKVHVSLALDPGAAAVDITASATTVGPTGVEMEALTAAAVAALCVYDMCKAASKGIMVTDLRLLAKSGGRSGDWRRSSDWRLGEPSVGGSDQR